MSKLDPHPFRNFIVTLRGLMADDTFRAAFATLSAMMIVGTIFYTIVEGWDVIDSFYFAVIAASTVGFGDFAPETTTGKLFTIVYVLVSVGLLVLILSRVARGMVERQMALLEGSEEGRRRRIRRPTREEMTDEAVGDDADHS